MTFCLKCCQTECICKNGVNMTKCRAKFKVESITETEAGLSIKLRPVTTGSPENEEFYKWTPGGEISLQVINKLSATFLVGHEYYVDFTEATQC